MSRQKITVRKVSFDEEQQMKDEAFLKLQPEDRLRIHEQLKSGESNTIKLPGRA